mmetsp:Transcript_2171/g.5873  ORF Transcript_2171/g.5873 Transcript_2171/m.5873 type:complete len:385 (-) Transcript_2171:131-1285(-)
MASNHVKQSEQSNESDVKQELARLLEWRDVSYQCDEDELSAAGSSLGIADLSGLGSLASSRGVGVANRSSVLSGLGSKASSRGVGSLAAASRSANSSRGVARTSRMSAGSSRGASSVRSGLSGSLIDGLEGIELDVGGRVTPEAAAARRKRLKELRAKKNLGMLRRQSSTAEGTRPTLRAATSGKYPGGDGLGDGTTLGHRYILNQSGHDAQSSGGASASHATATRGRDSAAVTERVLRTRELALRARQRQKDKMAALEEDNVDLSARQEFLESENEQLKLQIKQITDKIFGSVASSTGVTGATRDVELASGAQHESLETLHYSSADLVDQCIRDFGNGESEGMTMSPRDLISPPRGGASLTALAMSPRPANLRMVLSPRRHRN